MAAPNKKSELLPKIVELNASGMTVAEACAEVGVHPVTASKWFREGGLRPVKVRTGRPPQPDRHRIYTCEWCSTEISGLVSRPRRFCSVEHANAWQREHGSRQTVCPCGELVPKHSFAKYCSDECRKVHGKKKQPKPENHVTFTCQNEKCGKEVTRPKGQGYHKYCSNECAQKHTKTKKHIVVDDAVVLDSPWEALFWGLCSLHKVPVERFDRENGIPWRDGGWYAPDLYVPSMELAVEIKGLQDPEDPEKWATFRERYRLVVLDRESLKVLCGRVDSFSPTLGKMAYLQHEMI